MAIIEITKEIVNMEEINFVDLDVRDAAKVLMNLSTTRYEEVDNNLVKVNVGKYRVFVSTPDNSLKSIRNWNSYNQEPVCKKFVDLVMEYSSYKIVDILNLFKKRYQVKGEELSDEKFIKFYHKEKPSSIERNEYGRVWIDYESQLKDGSRIIHDLNDGYGIWAMNEEYADYKKYPIYLDRYGRNIMTVKTISSKNYIKLDNQIIGPSFEVIKKDSAHN